MKAIQKTTLHLGNFQIPVKVATLQKSNSLSFRNVHQSCNTKLKSLRYCPSCDKYDVPQNEIAKGYKLGDKMYQFDKEQIESIKEATHKDIQVIKTTKDLDISKIQKSYWLLPNEVNEKYALILKTLETKNEYLEVKYTLRSTENYGVIWANKGYLVLSQMVYPDQITTPDEEINAEISENLLKKSIALFDKIKENTQNAEVKNTAKEEFSKVLEKVINGEELPKPKVEKKKKEEKSLEEELEMAIT